MHTRTLFVTTLFIPLLLLLLPTTAATTTTTEETLKGCTCPSNETHIAWPSSSSSSNSCNCTYETIKEAEQNALLYLYQNIMEFDIPNAGTLGFPISNDDTPFQDDDNNHPSTTTTTTKLRTVKEQHRRKLLLPDGLSDNIINHTISLSLQAKQSYPSYTSMIPKSIYYEYVMNYANVNEARTNIKPLLYQVLHPLVQNLFMMFVEQQQQEEEKKNVTVNDAVILINQHLWTLLGHHRPYYQNNNNTSSSSSSSSNQKIQPIYFKSGQTPLIYDPMSVISYGYASCTGLSILFVNALRTFGIPSRLVGTPAWNGNVEKNGNHNWVEVWDNVSEEWKFLEPTVGTKPDNDYDNNGGRGGVVTLEKDVDHLDQNPCTRWFCNQERMDGTNTRVYAARLEQQQQQKEGGTYYYPMAWDSTNHGVQGEDRTEYYTNVCSVC